MRPTASVLKLVAYDHARELIIDPILSYATYFGGSGDDTSPSIAVDASGNIYLGGNDGLAARQLSARHHTDAIPDHADDEPAQHARFRGEDCAFETRARRSTRLS